MVVSSLLWLLLLSPSAFRFARDKAWKHLLWLRTHRSFAEDVTKSVSKEYAQSQCGEMLFAAPQFTGANDQRPVELAAAVPAQSIVKIIEVPQIT